MKTHIPEFGIETWQDDQERLRIYNPDTGQRSDWFSGLQHRDMFGILTVPIPMIKQVYPDWNND